MKWDFAIGNPAYQVENPASNRQEPVYHYFMEEASKIAEVTEMITPARFLFDAGQTPKAWNEKMLTDKHFKVLCYESDASVVFPSTEIKGGIAITIRNKGREYGAVGVFTVYPELNSILRKVTNATGEWLSKLFFPKSAFSFTNELYVDYPSLKSRLTEGNEYIIDANIFNKMPEVFTDNQFDNCIAVYGRANNGRAVRYISSRYIKKSDSVMAYKVIMPGANGAGKFGEILSGPFIGEPKSIHTQTFMHFGPFQEKSDAIACLTYIKTKFFRAMLGVLKVTQNTPESVWSKIPLLNFTSTSDINWNASIADIDQQLYKKYGLSQEEIDFIETHVKEMA